MYEDIPKPKRMILEKSKWHIKNGYQLTRIFPCKYLDQTLITKRLFSQLDQKEVVLKGTFIPDKFQTVVNDNVKETSFLHPGILLPSENQSVRSYKGQFLTDEKQIVYLSWFHNTEEPLKAKELSQKNKSVYLCGILKHVQAYGTIFSITNGEIIASREELAIQTRYPSIKGIAEHEMRQYIDLCLEEVREDLFPEQIISQNNLMSDFSSTKILHHPSKQQFHKAYQRYLLGELTYYRAKNMIEADDTVSCNVLYHLAVMEQAVKNLPQKLSDVQMETVTKIVQQMKNGKRVQARIEGSSETDRMMISVCLISAVCGNGYQAFYICKTEEDAKKMYEKCEEILSTLGIHSCFLTGENYDTESEDICNEIKNGTIKCVFGVPRALNGSNDFLHLALYILDEGNSCSLFNEHLTLKIQEKGIHTILFPTLMLPKSLKENAVYQQISFFQLQQTSVFNIKKNFKISQSEEETCHFVELYFHAPKRIIVITPPNNRKKSLARESFEKYSKQYKNVACITKQTSLRQKRKMEKEFTESPASILIVSSFADIIHLISISDVIILKNTEEYSLFSLYEMREKIGNTNPNTICVFEGDGSRLKILNETIPEELVVNDLDKVSPDSLLNIPRTSEWYFISIIKKYPKLFLSSEKLLKCMQKLEPLAAEEYVLKYESLNGYVNANV